MLNEKGETVRDLVVRVLKIELGKTTFATKHSDPNSCKICT